MSDPVDIVQNIALTGSVPETAGYVQDVDKDDEGLQECLVFALDSSYLQKCL